MDLLPGALSHVGMIWKYLSPAKSPFYAVLVVATTCLCWSHSLLLGHNDGISPEQFYTFAIPITALIAVGLYMSFSTVYELEQTEHDEQILFTRSFCISVALLCMIWNRTVASPIAAKISYWSCIVQILLFVIYTFLRLKKEQAPTHSNLIQLGLITGAFLIGFSYSLHIQPAAPFSPAFATAKQAAYVLDIPVATWVLYVAWLVCIYKWIKHFVSIIQINIE